MATAAVVKQQDNKSKSSRLGTCEVCRITEAKYTCPGCCTTTCSLSCVKKHKTDQDCDGIRPRTRFSKLSAMTDFDIHQDYKLLEEVNRTVEISRQEEKKTASKSGGNYVPKRLYLLKSHLLKIGTRVLFLPQTFQRHTKNRSYLNSWTNTIHWTLQLVFLNAEKLTIFEHKWPDNIPLLKLIEKYVQASPDEITPSAHSRLRCYREVDIHQIHVLLKADKVPQADKTFYQLDLEKTLQENLVGKTIVEFPQLFFVMQDFYRAKAVVVVPETSKSLSRRCSNQIKRTSRSKRAYLLLSNSKRNEQEDAAEQEPDTEESESETEEEVGMDQTGESASASMAYKDLVIK